MTFRTHGVDSFFKPSNMSCQILCSLKDPAKKVETNSVIYQINCEGISQDSNCRSTYIGETGKSLKIRFTEPQRCHNICISRGDRNTRSP